MMWKEMIVDYLRYYPNTSLEGQNKSEKNSQDSHSLGQNLNHGPPKQHGGVLATWLQYSAKII
jgi:hypothetical protein